VSHTKASFGTSIARPNQNLALLKHEMFVFFSLGYIKLDNNSERLCNGILPDYCFSVALQQGEDK